MSTNPEVSDAPSTPIGEARVVDDIREAIVRGEYAPNQRLIEADLSATFAASRATVRTALLELANEGLVERMPNKGSRVREISMDEAIEILEVRISVEGLCASKAAELITDEGIAEFTELRAALLASVEEGDLDEYTRLNRLLDQRIREISGHATAAEVLARLNAQSVRHQFKLWTRLARARVSVLEHVAMIDAITARDPEAARITVRTHLLSVIDALRALP